MFNLFRRIPVINKHTVEKNGLVYYKNELLDGEAKAIDSQNRKTLIVECLKGKKVGPWLEEMDNYGADEYGYIPYFFQWSNTRLLKYWKSHFAPRKKSYTGIKINRQLSDLEVSFRVESLADGLTYFSESRSMNISFYGSYHDGLKEGIWRSKSKYGHVLCDITFSNNEKHGKAIWYFVNGKIRCLGSYKNGKMSGEWTWYYKNGQVEKIIKFRNDLPYGQPKFFGSDGVAQGKQAVKKDRLAPLRKKKQEIDENLSIENEVKCDDGKTRIYKNSMFGIIKERRDNFKVNDISVSTDNESGSADESYDDVSVELRKIRDTFGDSYFREEEISNSYNSWIRNEKWFSWKGKKLNIEEILKYDKRNRSLNRRYNERFRDILPTTSITYKETVVRDDKKSELICINGYYFDLGFDGNLKKPFSGTIDGVDIINGLFEKHEPVDHKVNEKEKSTLSNELIKPELNFDDRDKEPPSNLKTTESFMDARHLEFLFVFVKGDIQNCVPRMIKSEKYSNNEILEYGSYIGANYTHTAKDSGGEMSPDQQLKLINSIYEVYVSIIQPNGISEEDKELIKAKYYELLNEDFNVIDSHLAEIEEAVSDH